MRAPCRIISYCPVLRWKLCSLKNGVVHRDGLLPFQYFQFLYNAKKWALNKENTSVLLFAHFGLKQREQNDVVDPLQDIPCIEELARQLQWMQNLTR